MKFHIDTAGIFVPDGTPEEAALGRTTHLCLAAHPDDIEIMAYHGILECFGRPDRGFLGAVITDGSGSPRDDLYAHYTDEEMQKVRRVEQKKAAYVGEYCAQIFLDYPSGAVKDPANPQVVADLQAIIAASRPRVIYTHNLADKHDTHVAAALRVVRALRELPAELHPEKVYGCEVWRDLDWLLDRDKVIFNVQAHENLAAALVGVFDSQICGGKRYDLATMGRRRAHASYHQSHGTDVSTALTFAMDLTPLVENPALEVAPFIRGFVNRFADDVTAKINRFA